MKELASEQSERDTYRSVEMEIVDNGTYVNEARASVYMSLEVA